MEVLLTAIWLLAGLIAAPIFLIMVLCALMSIIGGDL